MTGWKCPGCGACYSPLQMSCLCCVPGGPRTDPGWVFERVAGEVADVPPSPDDRQALMDASDPTLKALNKTAREKGAVGPNAIVPKYVMAIAYKDDRILDFGAGPTAYHSQRLREAGFEQVTAWEIGDSFDPEYHFSNALAYDDYYDIVMLSNVLNVQPSIKAVHAILTCVLRVLKPGGTLVFNYPRTPRKIDHNDQQICAVIKQMFDGASIRCQAVHLYACMKPS